MIGSRPPSESNELALRAIQTYLRRVYGTKATDDERQDLLIIAWNALTKGTLSASEVLRDEGPWKAYLFASFRNLVINQARRSTVKIDDEADADEVADPYTDYFESAHSEFLIRCEQCWQKLDETQRVVIRRAEIDGDSASQIGEDLNLSVQNVERVKTTALQRLRRCVQEKAKNGCENGLISFLSK